MFTVIRAFRLTSIFLFFFSLTLFWTPVTSVAAKHDNLAVRSFLYTQAPETRRRQRRSAGDLGELEPGTRVYFYARGRDSRGGLSINLTTTCNGEECELGEFVDLRTARARTYRKNRFFYVRYVFKVKSAGSFGMNIVVNSPNNSPANLSFNFTVPEAQKNDPHANVLALFDPDRDGRVSICDAARANSGFITRFGLRRKDSNYDVIYDFDLSGRISFGDLSFLADALPGITHGNSTYDALMDAENAELTNGECGLTLDLFTLAFGTKAGDPNYDKEFDFDRDDKINFGDLAVLADRLEELGIVSG